MPSRRLCLVLAALVAVVSALLTTSPAAAVADEASDAGHGHAHSHGPDGLALDSPESRARQARAVPAAAYAVDGHAPWAASEYDGRSFTVDQPDLTSLPTVHAVYMYPTKAANRFAQLAPMFQADARQASALLAQTRSSGVRFDDRAGGYLDITVIQSKYRANQLASGNQFSLVANELASRGFTNPNKKYVVWLDAGSSACGQGTLWNDTRRAANNYSDVNRTTGIVYRPYANDAATGGFCRGRTLLHELGHNMGALQGSVTPNDFDGAHCDDSAEDVMCYVRAAESRLGDAADTGGVEFDFGSNDYWDPPARLSWWTVNLSRFVCPSTGCDNPNQPDYAGPA